MHGSVSPDSLKWSVVQAPSGNPDGFTGTHSSTVEMEAGGDKLMNAESLMCTFGLWKASGAARESQPKHRESKETLGRKRDMSMSPVLIMKETSYLHVSHYTAHC